MVGRLGTLAQQILKEGNAERAEIWRLLDRAQAQNDHAVSAVTKRVIQISVVWAVALGVSRNLVGGGTLGSFAINDVSAVLLVCPLLISFLHYDLYASIAASGLAEDVMAACYELLFPNTSSNHWRKIDINPNIIEVDIAVSELSEGKLGQWLRGSSFLILMLTILGPVAATIHVSYLSIVGSHAAWLAGGVAAVAGVVTVRTLLLGIASVRA